MRRMFVVPSIFRGLFVAWMLLACVSSAVAERMKIVIQADSHLAPDRRMVAAALEAAGVEFEFEMAPLANEKRQLLLLEAGQTDVDLMPATGERLGSVKEGKSLVVPVPLDRGLLGYRHCLLMESKKDLLANVKTAEDLRPFTIGQGEGWMDVEVFKKAGIPVKWVRDWRKGEFIGQMEAGFIDLFPLGAEETESYFLPHYRALNPNISADPHLVIRYPWFRFVWVSASSKNGPAIHEALTRGFEIITKNGKFLELWDEAGRGLPAEFFKGRRIIDLTNPLYGYDLVGEKYRHLVLLTPPDLP